MPPQKNDSTPLSFPAKIRIISMNPLKKEKNVTGHSSHFSLFYNGMNTVLYFQSKFYLTCCAPRDDMMSCAVVKHFP